MSLSTRVGGTVLVAAALTVSLVPPAAAATTNSDRGRGNLVVCVHDLNGRDAEIGVEGRSDRTADTDGGCTFFHRLRTGWYDVELDAPGACDNDSDTVKVRRHRTAVVHLDADCPRRSNDNWDWHDEDEGDDDD